MGPATTLDTHVKDSSVHQGRVSYVHYDDRKKRLRLQLIYGEKSVQTGEVSGTSYFLRNSTYVNGEVDALLRQFALSCPTQLLGRDVTVHPHSSRPYKIEPLQ